MSLFHFFNKKRPVQTLCLIPYGGMKKDGSHDHRYNRGPDRTEAQKRGDRKRGKHE